jgi:hypothetical protein
VIALGGGNVTCPFHSDFTRALGAEFDAIVKSFKLLKTE